MQSTKAIHSILAFSFIFLTTSASSFAAPKQIKLPPETAKLPKSELAGYQLATQKCMICHSVDYIFYQPPGMNQAQWTAEVAKMKHSYGAMLSETDIKSIGAYLAVVYGTAKATDSEVIAASANSSQPKTNREPQAQELLTSSGCMGCHAIDNKVLGPSFKDIAAKYKQEAQAQNMLATSIQKGGVGKWGEIPMPPMANLTAEQAKGLAKFILEQ
ncbi:MAG: c-type cytochrome [Methyloprofundus sp.]|nr:c-type cytochrome [Methyloprofundus sp.]